VRLVSRVAGGLARRLDRPELLAAVNAHARRAQGDDLAIGAILASALGGEGAYVDVGTNRGQVLGKAVHVAPRGRHVAFEPIPELAEQVAAAFPGVDTRRKALGARPDRAEFCHFRALDGWSGLRRRPEISDQRGAPEYFEVEVSTLDLELAGAEPRVVKIDVEGAEVAVLEGGRELLARARPIVIFEHDFGPASLYGVQPGAPFDLLDGLGYEIYSALGDGPYDRDRFVREHDVLNWLATPRSGAPA
jgi:FkbM family methyltransferase